MFDNTITMGNLLQIIAMLLGGLYFVWVMEKKIALLTVTQTTFAAKLTEIDTEVKNITKITVEMAIQNERLVALDKRLNELSIRIEDTGKLTKLLLPPARSPRRSNKD